MLRRIKPQGSLKIKQKLALPTKIMALALRDYSSTINNGLKCVPFVFRIKAISKDLLIDIG